jgi:hypothetical protein
MNELAICDHFKWGLTEVRKLTLREYNGIMEYFKKLKKEQDKMERKAKSARRKR